VIWRSHLQAARSNSSIVGDVEKSYDVSGLDQRHLAFSHLHDEFFDAPRLFGLGQSGTSPEKAGALQYLSGETTGAPDFQMHRALNIITLPSHLEGSGWPIQARFWLAWGSCAAGRSHPLVPFIFTFARK
jgi:hypothetical protein